MDPLSLLYFVLNLKYERLWVLYFLPIAIVLILILTLNSMIRLRKISKALPSKKSRVYIVSLILLINMLAKIGTSTMMIVLLAKPYIYYEKEVMITREMKTMYFGREVMVILLIDCSHSMKEKINGKTKFALTKEIAIKIIEELTDKDRFHVVFFAEELITSPLENSSREYAKLFIKSINKTKNYTTIANALSYAISFYEITEEPISIILISDGADNSGVNPINIALEANRRGIPIFTIYVGGIKYKNPQLLKSIARITNSTFLDLTKLSEETLKHTIKRFVEDIKYETLSRRMDMKVRVPIKDYETPMRTLLNYLLLTLLVMLLSGV